MKKVQQRNIKPLPHNPDFYNLKKKPFENLVEKGENAGN